MRAVWLRRSRALSEVGDVVLGDFDTVWEILKPENPSRKRQLAGHRYQATTLQKKS
jgi:hypothetical protein